MQKDCVWSRKISGFKKRYVSTLKVFSFMGTRETLVFELYGPSRPVPDDQSVHDFKVFLQTWRAQDYLSPKQIYLNLEGIERSQIKGTETEPFLPRESPTITSINSNKKGNKFLLIIYPLWEMDQSFKGTKVVEDGPFQGLVRKPLGTQTHFP